MKTRTLCNLAVAMAAAMTATFGCGNEQDTKDAVSEGTSSIGAAKVLTEASWQGTGDHSSDMLLFKEDGTVTVYLSGKCVRWNWEPLGAGSVLIRRNTPSEQIRYVWNFETEAEGNLLTLEWDGSTRRYVSTGMKFLPWGVAASCTRL